MVPSLVVFVTIDETQLGSFRNFRGAGRCRGGRTHWWCHRPSYSSQSKNPRWVRFVVFPVFERLTLGPPTGHTNPKRERGDRRRLSPPWRVGLESGRFRPSCTQRMSKPL